MRMVAQAVPLHIEPVLLAFDERHLGGESRARRSECLRLAVPQPLRPAPEGRARLRARQRFEQRVVGEPRGARLEKSGLARRGRVGQLGGIEQRRVPRAIRARPEGRAVGAAGTDRQHLPDGKAGGREPVDERAAAAPERRLERR